MHTNQRPLNSSIDSVTFTGGATDASVKLLLEMIELQKEQLSMMRSIFLVLCEVSNKDPSSIEQEFFN